MGNITREGSRILRTVMIQAAHVAVKKPNRMQSFFYKLLKRSKNKNVAITAVARKMLYVIWFMLTYENPYMDRT